MTKSYPRKGAGSATERGDATRARIIAATIEVVGARGWDAATTREIAALAGANQGLIHYHFGSRARLLEAAFDAAMHDMFAGPMEALLAAPSLPEGAARLVLALGEMDAADPAARFSMEALSRAGREERLRLTAGRALAEFRAIVAERIGDAQRGGDLDPDLDPDGTAVALAALFDGLGLHLLIDPTIDTRRTAAAVRRVLAGADHPRTNDPINHTSERTARD